jgi:site-specific DNA-methyltransferase (adenine-specific)
MNLNSVIQGDCLEVMKDITDKSIDMILCDLPYGTTACKWDTIIPFEPLWEQYKRIIKDNGAIVLTASQPFTSALVMSNIKMFKYEWVWNKDKAGNIMCSGYQPMKVHENIVVFSKSKTVFNKQMTEAKLENMRPTGKEYKNRDSIVGVHNWKHSEKRDNTKRNPKTIINISSVSAECNNTKRLHPTQKPVALFEYLIKTYTNEGNLVLDNCAGSGTTAIACLNTNRNYILIEKEPEYIEVINNRINSLKKE